MATTQQPVTITDLAELPDDGFRRDLIRGELICMAPATGEHGAIAGELARLIGNVVVPERRGRVYTAEAGFILARNPDVLLCPDVSFVRAEVLPPLREQRTLLELAPDLAVEVLSPSNSLRDVRRKVEEYLRGGAGAVWVVDPIRRSITVHVADDMTVLSEDDVLDGGVVLPGFSVLVADIFE